MNLATKNPFTRPTAAPMAITARSTTIRHRVKTLEHLVRVIAHLEQRSGDASRESDAAAGGNIGTGQHYASRNAQSDRQFCRRERDYIDYRRNRKERRHFYGYENYCRKNYDVHCVIEKQIAYGPFFICGSNREGDFTSLTEEQIEDYTKKFEEIEQFTGHEPELVPRMIFLGF